MSAKHTRTPLSLPWTLKPVPNTRFFEVRDNDGDLQHALLSKDEAEFIVNAVNSHVGLEAVADAAAYLLDALPGADQRKAVKRLERAIDKAPRIAQTEVPT